MADTKISALPSLTTLADADIVPVSQSGTTKGATALKFKNYIGSGGTISQVTGSDFTTSSTTLVNITGLTFAAAINSKYEVDVLLKVQSTNTAGIKYSIGFSAAGASGQVLIFRTGAQNSTAGGVDSVAIGTSNGISTTDANVDYTLWMKSIVTIGGNAGNITAQVLKVTSGTATIYIGSRMTVTLLA